LTILDLQGFYIHNEDLLSVLSHLEKLKKFHYHAEVMYSTNWDEVFTILDKIPDEDGWFVKQSDLDKLSGKCKTHYSAETKDCTMVE